MLITYLLMAALFESWLYPFVVILSVPLGAVGGFVGLWLLNMFVLPRRGAAAGRADDAGLHHPGGHGGEQPDSDRRAGAESTCATTAWTIAQAVLESVRTRIRPIFMTALIGLFGLLPLVISPGAGSELYRGIGAVLLGGLLVSTVFTLFLVPSLFTLTLEAKDALVRLLFGHAGEEVPEWEREELPAPETVTVRHANETHVLHPPLAAPNSNRSHSTSRTAIAVPPDANGEANP